MCAINGFSWKDESLISSMNNITKHRGPDGSHFFLEEEVSLGHNRLSIIDLSKEADQPMTSDDGRFVIVYNGELYNFQDIKKDLDEYSFKTKSDTEVILAAYKKWGKNCVKKFNGIFAFAIFDKESKEIFLARDHIGVKPLYYYHDGNRLIFSSEIKAILEHDIHRKISKDAFNHYFRVMYVPEPLTMFENIYKLPKAHTAVFKEGKLSLDPYWESSLEDRQISFKKAKIETRNRIGEAINRQLVSDRPLGVYLSGGFDSSIILDRVSKFSKNIDTFSVGFDLTDEEESDKFNKDFYLARETASHYKTRHHEVILSPEDVLRCLKKVIWHLDEPISNPTEIAMFKLAEFSKNKVDVVLGGDGGDELFGGYERYRLSRAATWWHFLPPFIRKILVFNSRMKKLNTPAGVDRFGLFLFQKDEILEKVLSNRYFDEDVTRTFFENNFFTNKKDSFDKVFMNTDRKSWLVDESLVRTDKMSMAHGLEARVPFLDKDLVSFAESIPINFKVSPFDTKILLKMSFYKDLPKTLFSQPKRGWFSPGAKWLRRPEIRQFAKNILSREYNPNTENLFNWQEVETIFEDHISRKKYNLTIIWAIMTFQLWAKIYDVKV